MDRHFLEFWGHYLLSVARGQKQLEDITRWIRQGCQGANEMTEMFKNYYGLEDDGMSTPESRSAWEKAASDFKESFRDYFRIMGWISEEKYQALEEENQSLKETIAEQEQTIKRLRNLIRQPVIDQSQTLDVLRELINKQSDEFQQLLANFSVSPEVDGDDSDP
jgi:Asp-tRNA(Asn)/Glu-tRNA(Gln) amidotransferase B subunit